MQSEVLFEEMQGQGGHLGIITLNRPQVLNSLNQTMLLAIHAQLKLWADATHIKAVVIRAVEGKAFCAGGDLRLIYDKCKIHDKTAIDFFRDEYQLNRYIYHYQKPYIALLDGITMGGGVGISIHGSHRVATERLMFAMPETGIGFFPDVGGTYFLPRLPNYFGYYLGLTGARIFTDDCVALGIAQCKVAHDDLSALLSALAETPFADDAKKSVTNIINQFSSATQSSTLFSHQTMVESCFAKKNMEDILHALTISTNAFAKETIEIISKKSPTSLKVTLHALQQGKQLSFDDCMQQEFRLTSRFLQGHDFFEGIRAIIIDKDQSPKWHPNTIAGVKLNEVEKYFAPLTQELA